MDQASGTGVAASSSASAHRAASPGAEPMDQDEQILSAFSKLRLHTPTDPQREPASAVDTYSFGPGGPGRTSPSTIPRLAAGRGRGRTLPAWMMSGEHAVPGGLRESSARAEPTGLPSPPPQHDLQGGQQPDPTADTSFQVGVRKKGKNKSKKKKQQNTAETSSKNSTGGADVHGSARAAPARQCGPAPASEPSTGIWMEGPPSAARSPQAGPRLAAGSDLGTILQAAVARGPVLVQGGLQERAPLGSAGAAQPQMSRPTGSYPSRPQQNTPLSGQRASSPTNGGKRMKHINELHDNQAAAGGGTRGGVSSARPPSTAPPAMAASNRAPDAGVSVAGVGRGRQRTLPAWMTSGAVPGGLQQQLPHGGDAWAQVPRATALN